MSIKFWLVAPLALAALVGAGVHGWNLVECQQMCSVSAAEDGSQDLVRLPWDESQCCAPESAGESHNLAAVREINPDQQIVFKLEGLGCPAVNGIGCGHMLHPLLASLDRIDGVRASSTNFTGTMIRVALTNAGDQARVAEETRKALAANNPVALTGDEFELALEKEQWYDARQVGELSAIEFRTLAFSRIKMFAQAEKLDEQTTDKLMKLAEAHWQRLEQDAKQEKATLPEEWLDRAKKSIPDFLTGVKKVLSNDQLERFEQALVTPHQDGKRPEAPAT